MFRGQRYIQGGGRSSRARGNHGRDYHVDTALAEPKVRGTPSQIIEQYLGLARDAVSSGDWIAAEGFYQHADHYRRVLAPQDIEVSSCESRAAIPHRKTKRNSQVASQANWCSKRSAFMDVNRPLESPDVVRSFKEEVA